MAFAVGMWHCGHSALGTASLDSIVAPAVFPISTLHKNAGETPASQRIKPGALGVFQSPKSKSAPIVTP